MRSLFCLLWMLAGPIASAAPPAAAAPQPQKTHKAALNYDDLGDRGNITVYHAPPAPQGAPSSIPGAVPGATSSPHPGEDAADELMRLRAEQQKAWATVNANNPMSADYASGTPGATGGTGPFEQINRILSQPAVQAYMRFFNNPIFSKGVDQVINSPNRMTLLYVELGFLVFMLIFRAWRLSKAEHWAARLWTRIWTLLMFWSGAVVALPWAVLGDPYYQTLSGAFVVLMSYIKK